MLDVAGTSSLGDVKITVTQGRGLSADEITELALSKIVSVADTAPEPIRAQAEAFQARVRAVLLHYIRLSKKSGLTDVYNVLRDHGQHEAAAIVQKLNQES